MEAATVVIGKGITMQLAATGFLADPPPRENAALAGPMRVKGCSRGLHVSIERRDRQQILQDGGVKNGCNVVVHCRRNESLGVSAGLDPQPLGNQGSHVGNETADDHSPRDGEQRVVFPIAFLFCPSATEGRRETVRNKMF